MVYQQPPFTGNKSQLSLAGITFNSPTALSNHVRHLLYSQPLGIPFTGGDDSLLREWASYHPDAQLKTGPGIKHFFVRENTDYGSPGRCICIYRTDGKSVEISYKEPSKALVQLLRNGELRRPSSEAANDLRTALRTTVIPQCIALKKRIFQDSPLVTCPVTMREITYREAHIDHIYPMTFDAIAWHWCLIWDLRPQEVEIQDLGTKLALKDECLARAWSDFHLESANLRVISSEANIAAPVYPTNWNVFS